ncbi:MAG TPA: lysylphosphatidylglycerol synthase transmembrane domain-containing protein [Saprospiraceae bacterium]|mgnify:CR=1 FL=1|nr:flippase-like domain-containing protein [Saprospiraceae bacterium]HRO09206.1 lysylphosphatidylglycerol synthase transmembrane domain-containing protein [Saprospiraceae bacterium]HRP42500.1 lysylphosphatidylglycerol synthase transmembrane domain-containing protein [Saprospiraceae bacterium]
MPQKKINFKKIINRLIIFISLGVGAHIVFVLLTTEKSLLGYMQRISIWHIAAIMGLLYTPWILYALRVYIWSKFLKEKISYRTLLKIVITSELASALSPTAIGGAPVKAALLLNYGFSAGSAGFLLTYGVVEDILFYTTGILLATFLSIGVISDIEHVLHTFFAQHTWMILIIITTLTLYIYLTKTRQIPAPFRIWTYLPAGFKNKYLRFRIKALDSWKDMKSNFQRAFASGKLVMVTSLLLLFMQWMAKFSVLLIILHAFGISFEPLQVYLRQWVVYVTMLLVPTPGATGGAEASFLLIFGKSIPAELSFLITSLWRLFTYYMVLLSAVIFYNALSIIFKKDEEIYVEDKSENQ